MIITNKEFDILSKYIKKNYGINLNTTKKSLVVGRLEGTLAEGGFGNFSEYIDHLMKDSTGKAVANFVSKITVNYTFFMREADHFHYFGNEVLSYWCEQVKDSRDLRIWSAGCSSGEEPYILAMIIADFLGINRGRWNGQILATDISERVLDKARSGVYNTDSIKDVPERWRKIYFNQINSENSEIVDSIKKEVIFRKFNLMCPSLPFKKKFHVIFCRNVMIYFDTKTKMELVKKFYDYTECGGYLFLGHSEFLGRNESNYKYVMPAVYRKE